MLKKIAIQDLRPGMYVVNSGLSWIEYPYLYMREGVVATEDAVRAIAAEGFTEAVIDTDLCVGLDMASVESEADISHRISALAEYIPPGPTVALSEELKRAVALYSDSVKQARSIMDDVRMGRALDVDASSPVVEEIIGSVTRNCDALTGLSKLRSFDEYTFTHCVNVAVLAVVFGRFLGKTEDDLRVLGMAGLFHDVGKQLVPQDVLNKPGKLTEAEFVQMKQHPSLGYNHLKKQAGAEGGEVNPVVLAGVLEHHEKYNGTGYPGGLAGDTISEAGRILAVADVYDALTSQRVYKAPMLPHKALGLMYSMRGKEFHPGYVERFIKCLGIYPVGTTVLLNSGHVGVVYGSNPRIPLQPQVLVAAGSLGAILPRRVDLAEHPQLRVSSVADPARYGMNPEQLLERFAG